MLTGICPPEECLFKNETFSPSTLKTETSLEPGLQTKRNLPSFVHSKAFCDLKGALIPFPKVESVKMESNFPS